MKYAAKCNFQGLTILITKIFLIGGAPTNEFLISIQFTPIEKPSPAFPSSNLFFQKWFFAWNYKFFQILIHTEKTREIIINLWYLIDVQRTRGILNNVICTAHFSSNFNSVFTKKVEKTFCACAVQHVKKEEQNFVIFLNTFDTSSF